jgi:hypothetical protein
MGGPLSTCLTHLGLYCAALFNRCPLQLLRIPDRTRSGRLARMVTWRDLGAGLGPLAAGVLLPLVPAFVL